MSNIINDISSIYYGQIVESYVPGKPAEKLGAVTDIPQDEREAARERTLAKAKAMRAKKGLKSEEYVGEAVKGADTEMRREASKERRTKDGKRLPPSEGRGYATQQKQSISFHNKRSKGKHIPGFTYSESLDPVGKEDADVDNDGKKNTQSDKYLLNRRKAVGKAISTQEAKEVKRWWDDDGDGKGYEEGEVSGKFKKKKKAVKEGFSNWREDLIEIADMIEAKDEKNKVVEKKVNNKIKINPPISEAVENLGGTLLEMVEIDEIDYIVESVYDELLDEGYEDEDIENAIEYALTEAKVTFGHDTPSTPEKKKEGLLSVARRKLSGLKKSAKQAVATGARKVAKGALGVARKMEGGDKTPSSAHTKTRTASTYRGAGAGTKERVSSGSYTPPTKKKAETSSDPWEGSYSKSSDVKTKAKPAAKAKPKAKPKTTKVKKTDKLDDLLASVRNESVIIDEKTLTAAETKKKEELVKSMKKSSSDFETRYPGRGKEVMYATATKMAKKMAEQALEMKPKTQEPKQKPLDTPLERQRYANLKITQQKQQQLEKQRLNLQKQGRLPLDSH